MASLKEQIVTAKSARKDTVGDFQAGTRPRQLTSRCRKSVASSWRASPR